MRDTLRELVATWRRGGQALDFGIGVDVGYATRGEQLLPWLTRPVDVFAVDGARASHPPSALHSPQPQASAGPLTGREREVVELIVRGYTNRQIAAELIIAETPSGLETRILGRAPT